MIKYSLGQLIITALLLKISLSSAKLNTYHQECNAFVAFQISFAALTSSIYTATAAYPQSQINGFKLSHSIRWFKIDSSSSQQYDIYTRVISSSQTHVTVSCSSQFISEISNLNLRVIIYSGSISSSIFVGELLLIGPYNTNITKYVSFNSSTIFQGAYVQTYITGFHTIHHPIFGIQTLSGGLNVVSNQNKFIIQIFYIDFIPPYGSIKNITISYLVFFKEIFLLPQVKVKFQIVTRQLSNTTIHTGGVPKRFLYTPDQKLIDSKVHFGMVKMMMDPISTSYAGFIYPNTSFQIYYINSYYIKFNLILIENISLSGKCCGINKYDWGSNTCGPCDIKTYFNFYPNFHCPWMCSQCCTSPKLQCYQCVGPNIRLVQGGCTNITGCVKVTSNYSSSQCVQCDKSFTNYNPVSKKCQCSNGFRQVSGLCTNISGCRAVKRQNYIIKCVACNIFQNFVYNGKNSCMCKAGYQYNFQLLVCFQICGDGKIFNHACDDGNNISEDGCSKECIIEKYYTCVGGNNVAASICTLNVRELKIYPYFIDRIGYQNKGQFKFKIQTRPNVAISQEMIQNLYLQTSKKVQIQYFTIKNGYLTCFINYYQTIQGFPAILHIKFNKTKITYDQIDLFFDMISFNIYLTYEQENIYLTKMIPIVLIPLSYLTILIGLITHKLTGPEQIHSNILILFIYLFSSGKNVVLMPIQFLSLLNINTKYIQNRKDNIYIFQNSRFQQQNLQTSLLLIFSLNLLLIILIGLRCLVHLLIPKKKKFIYYFSITGNIYHRIVFPIGFSLIYLQIFGGIFYFLQNKNIMLKFIHFISILGMSILFFNQFFGCIYQREIPQSIISWSGVKKCNNYYLPVFMTYIILCIMCVEIASLGLILKTKVSIFIFLFTLIIMIYFCYSMPYQNQYDNISQIFNLFGVLYFSFWFFLRQYESDMKKTYNELAIFNGYNLIVLIIITLSLLRSYKHILYYYRNKQKQQVCIFDQENQQKNEQKMQNYFIRSNAAVMKNEKQNEKIIKNDNKSIIGNKICIQNELRQKLKNKKQKIINFRNFLNNQQIIKFAQ